METTKIIKYNGNVRTFTFKTLKHINRTEMLLSPIKQIERIREKQVQLVVGKQLYQHGIFDFRNKIY